MESKSARANKEWRERQKVNPKYGFRNCLYCKIQIPITMKKDIDRKKYCSHSCRQKYRYENGEMDEQLKKACLAMSTPETNVKKGRSGPSHSRYKADRSQIKSPRPRYEQTCWRKAVFERDNYTCQICGVRGGKLAADHIKPYAIYKEDRWKLENGRTLCDPCHKKTPTYGSKTIKLMRSMKL